MYVKRSLLFPSFKCIAKLISIITDFKANFGINFLSVYTIEEEIHRASNIPDFKPKVRVGYEGYNILDFKTKVRIGYEGSNIPDFKSKIRVG